MQSYRQCRIHAIMVVLAVSGVSMQQRHTVQISSWHVRAQDLLVTA